MMQRVGVDRAGPANCEFWSTEIHEWESDLAIPGVEVFQLDRDGSDAVLLWSNEAMKVNVDLTGIFAGRVRVIGLNDGLTLSEIAGTPTNQILVANEPLWITLVPEPATLSLLIASILTACDRRRRW